MGQFFHHDYLFPSLFACDNPNTTAMVTIRWATDKECTNLLNPHRRLSHPHLTPLDSKGSGCPRERRLCVRDVSLPSRTLSERLGSLGELSGNVCLACGEGGAEIRLQARHTRRCSSLLCLSLCRHPPLHPPPTPLN